MRPAHTVEYQDDDGNWCYALVKSENDDGSLNLLYKAHTGGAMEVANNVSADSDRVR